MNRRASSVPVCCCLLWVLAISMAGARPLAADGAHRVLAIYQDNETARTKAIVATLQTALSQQKGLSLVERERLRTVLSEQNLGGVSGARRAVKVGQVVGADAVLMLEPLDKRGTRLRMLDTPTGVVLAETIYGPERAVAAKPLLKRLKPALQAARVPRADRQHVAVLTTRNEEQSPALQSLCNTLPVLLRSQLARHPEIVTLERDKLQRLVREHRFTDQQRKLRPAAYLLETALRRRGDKKTHLTLKLTALAHGNAKTASVNVKRSATAVRRAAMSKLMDLLATNRQQEQANATPAEEAEALVRRAELNKSGQRLALIEAAVALAPNQARYLKAVDYYRQHINDRGYPTPSRSEKLIDIFETELRFQDLVSTYIRRYFPASPKGNGRNLRPRGVYPVIRSHVEEAALQVENKSSRFRTLLNRVRRGYRRNLGLLQKAHARHDLKPRSVIVERIEHAYDLANGPEQFARDIRGRLREMYNGVKAVGERDYAKHRLYNALTGVLARFGHSDQKWNSEQHESLRHDLMDHPDPFVRAAAHYPGMFHGRGNSMRATKNLLNTLYFETPAEHQFVCCPELVGVTVMTYNVGPGHAASVLSNRGALEPYLDKLLEKTRERPAVLARWPRLTKELVGARRGLQQLVRERLDEASMPDYMQERAKKLRRLLKPDEREDEEKPDKRHPWRQYRAKVLSLKDRPDKYQVLEAIYVDPHHSDRPLIMIWHNTDHYHEPFTVYITRHDRSGGNMQQIARFDNVTREAFTRHEPRWAADMVSTDSAIYFASIRQGLIRIDAAGTQIYGQDNGAPDNTVRALAVVKDKIYTAHGETLARFDPKQERFNGITSSRYLADDSPLDGGEAYRIGALSSGLKGKYLYLAINAHREREGLWRYNPKTESFDQLAPIHRDDVEWMTVLQDRYLWLGHDHPNVSRYDLVDKTMDPPKHKIRFDVYDGLVRSGTHVFHSASLYTQDGKHYQPDWMKDKSSQTAFRAMVELPQDLLTVG